MRVGNLLWAGKSCREKVGGREKMGGNYEKGGGKPWAGEKRRGKVGGDGKLIWRDIFWGGEREPTLLERGFHLINSFIFTSRFNL